jgi:hypothetical protein
LKVEGSRTTTTNENEPGSGKDILDLSSRITKGKKMAPDDRHDSAPDLRILGDRITLQPSGFVEPVLTGEEGKEEALMKHMARFRSEPLR